MPNSSSHHVVVRTFGVFSFDLESLQLRRGAAPVPLEPQPARLLGLLLSRPGELVTREEIVQHLWGGATHVSYGDGLHYAVRQIRQALQDDPKRPAYIETLPRRGYRFAAVVERPQPPVSRWSLAGTAAAAVATGVAVLESVPNAHHETTVDLLRILHRLLF